MCIMIVRELEQVNLPFLDRPDQTLGVAVLWSHWFGANLSPDVSSGGWRARLVQQRGSFLLSACRFSGSDFDSDSNLTGSCFGSRTSAIAC